MPLEHLRLEDLSDREFLLVLIDVAEDDNWSDSQAVADALDLKERKTASSRLSWLQRWGVVEREHERDESGNLRYRRNGKPFHTQRWRPTPIGHDMATGKLRKQQEQALRDARDGEMLMLAGVFGTYQRDAPLAVRQLMKREYRYRAEFSRNGSS